MTLARLALAIGFATLFAAPLRAEQWVSSYTTHDYAKCRKDKGDGDPTMRHYVPLGRGCDAFFPHLASRLICLRCWWTPDISTSIALAYSESACEYCFAATADLARS